MRVTLSRFLVYDHETIVSRVHIVHHSGILFAGPLGCDVKVPVEQTAVPRTPSTSAVELNVLRQTGGISFDQKPLFSNWDTFRQWHVPIVLYFLPEENQVNSRYPGMSDCGTLISCPCRCENQPFKEMFKT